MLPLYDANQRDRDAVVKLEGLQRASSKRSGATDVDTAGLFSPDADFLRFIIAGACAPLFLQGVIKDDSPVSKDCNKLQMNPAQCVVLTKIKPKESANEGPLFAALTSVGVSVKTVRKITPDRFLVEMALTKEEALRERAGSVELTHDLCYHAKFLFQLYHSKGRALALPNPSSRPGMGVIDEILIGGLQCAREVQWHIGESSVRAVASWRTMIGTMCEFSGGVKHRFASCLSVLGTENEHQVRAQGVSVLPGGIFGKVLQLIFTPRAAQVKQEFAELEFTVQAPKRNEAVMIHT